MNGSTEGRRGSDFLLKYHSKNVLKAVGWDANPDPSKKLIEMQNANNSGSGRGPDPRIIFFPVTRLFTRMHTDSDS
jgi:hypothetical protein